MSKSVAISGHCLCGRVSLRAGKLSTELEACHCGMCRRWGSGPLLALHGSDVALQPEEDVAVYHSSAWAERGFCRCCGSHLFYRLKDRSAWYLPVGLFDDLADVHLTNQIFIDKKPCYYTFAEQTRNMTEAEVMALFASQG